MHLKKRIESIYRNKRFRNSRQLSREICRVAVSVGRSLFRHPDTEYKSELRLPWFSISGSLIVFAPIRTPSFVASIETTAQM